MSRNIAEQRNNGRAINAVAVVAAGVELGSRCINPVLLTLSLAGVGFGSNQVRSADSSGLLSPKERAAISRAGYNQSSRR